MKEHIRRDHFILRKSIRQIAKERHVARKTIRAALRDASPTVYKRKSEPPSPVLGPFQGIIRQISKDCGKGTQSVSGAYCPCAVTLGVCGDPIG
jgi:hypothetical protein